MGNMKDMQHQYTRRSSSTRVARKSPLLKKFEEQYGRVPTWDEAKELFRSGKVTSLHPEGWDL